MGIKKSQYLVSESWVGSVKYGYQEKSVLRAEVA